MARRSESTAPICDTGFPELAAAELPSQAWPTRLLTGGGSALDAGVLRAMQLVVERALIPDSEHIDALRESAQAVLSPELQADPRRFFGFLDEPPHALRMKSRYRRQLDGGAVIACRIESDYAPNWADIDGSDGPLLVDHWVHEPGRPRGTPGASSLARVTTRKAARPGSPRRSCAARSASTRRSATRSASPGSG